MRKWGLLITAFYLCALIFLLLPLLAWLFSPDSWDWDFWWPFEWDINLVIWIALLVTAEALLLLVTVDDSFRRMKPRTHIGISIAAIALAIGLLMACAVWAVIVVIWADDATTDATTPLFWGTVAVLWLAWGGVFRAYEAGLSSRLDRMVDWLLKGSVLELLIVVPCHVFVRHRNDCSAPAVTGFGIATGLAVMLMGFGPSIVFLYRKRLRRYRGSSESRVVAAEIPDETESN
jgi:hypothetical protein